MRKKLIAIILFFVTSISFGQRQIDSLDIQDYLNKSFISSYEKEYHNFYKITDRYGTDLEISTYKSTSLITKDEYLGLYFNAVNYIPAYRGSNFAIINKDEVNELVKYFDFCLSKSNLKFDFPKEYTFSTNYFRVVFYNTKSNPNSTKLFTKTEESYNYWNFKIIIGNIGKVILELPDFKKADELNSKLKALKFN